LRLDLVVVVVVVVVVAKCPELGNGGGGFGGVVEVVFGFTANVGWLVLLAHRCRRPLSWTTNFPFLSACHTSELTEESIADKETPPEWSYSIV
jgi:hypothetical protein